MHTSTLNPIWILATPISNVGPSKFNIEGCLRCRSLRYRMQPRSQRLYLWSHSRRLEGQRTFDIETVWYRRSQTSISKVNFQGYRYRSFKTSISDKQTSILYFDIVISYPISKLKLTFDIEGHVQNIGFDIRHDILYDQWHSLQSITSLCPGFTMPALKSLRLSAARAWIPTPSFCAIPQLGP